MTLNKVGMVSLKTFDSEDEIGIPSVSVQNKSSKMEMSNMPESLNITKII